jgi:error-prone DNA polymerase
MSWRTNAGRAGDHAAETQPADPVDPPEPEGSREPVTPWAELHCHSAFSFLDGAATPDELAAEAARLGVEVLALTDHDGMYGVPQLAQAAARLADRGTRLGTVFGAELTLDGGARAGAPDPEGRHLLVLARDPQGYRRLSAVISAAQLAGGGKGRQAYDVGALAGAHGGHWAVLTGCRKGRCPPRSPPAARRRPGGS